MVIDRLFSPEQLKQMSAEEIQLALDVAIQNDDYEWNRNAKIAYDGKGRIAHQMHTLLYRCPRCGKEFTMRGEGAPSVASPAETARASTRTTA